MSDETGGDAVDTTDTSDTDVNAKKSKALVVPGNILPWIEAAADETGVPVELLAAVIYQHSRFTGLTPGLVMQVAQGIGNQFDQMPFQGDYPDDRTPNENMWLDAAAAWAYQDPYSTAAAAYRGNLAQVYRRTSLIDEVKGGKKTGNLVTDQGTGLTLGPDKTLPSGKFTTARFPGGLGGGAAYGPGGAGGPAAKLPIIPGLSDDDAIAVQRVADPLFLKYLGRLPTTDEYVDMSKKRWNPQTLEMHLRNQPFKDANGNVVAGMTLGRAGDVRGLANQYANDIMGRDADEGEIAWMIQNGIPANPEHISAFFQQLHDNQVWHGNPTEWRDMQKRIQHIWDTLGLTGKVDAATINAAVDGKMTDSQVTDQLRARPAPGYPQGVSVGEVERLRSLAESVKNDLFPGEAVSDAELHHLQGMSPEDVRAYFRSIVAKDSKTGLPVGIEKDYRAMANSVLSKYGVAGYDVSPEDLKFFALTQADPSTILQHFAENPAIAAAHPGLAYGMTTDQYGQAVQAYQDAYGGVFGGAALAAPRAGAAKAEREGGLLGYALSQGIQPGDFSQTLETLRQERGKAPTAAEFRERSTRPSTARPTGGGASAQLPQTSDERTQRGEPRPAVGARA